MLFNDVSRLECVEVFNISQKDKLLQAFDITFRPCQTSKVPEGYGLLEVALDETIRPHNLAAARFLPHNQRGFLAILGTLVKRQSLLFEDLFVLRFLI